MSVPNVIRLSYQRNEQAGLVAAYSADLKGLLVTASTFEELYEELPTVIADLVKKQHGLEVTVEWCDEEAVAPGFGSVECARLEIAA
jgi:hypothetical protein